MSAEIRLGVIVPSVNIVVEAWYPRAVPAGVSVHFARMLMPDGTSPERIIEMDRTDGVHSIHQLASCRPHAIAYGCTASSIVQGHAFDAHLREEIRHIAGVPGTSATHSIFTACARLGMRRVTAISPYAAAVDAAVAVPTVGIGAGNATTGQVLVWQDMAGLRGGKMAKFVKQYADLRTSLSDAAKAYGDEVRTGQFPGPEHSF